MGAEYAQRITHLDIAGLGGKYPQIGTLGFGELALAVGCNRLIVKGPQIHQNVHRKRGKSVRRPDFSAARAEAQAKTK